MQFYICTHGNILKRTKDNPMHTNAARADQRPAAF